MSPISVIKGAINRNERNVDENECSAAFQLSDCGWPHFEKHERCKFHGHIEEEPRHAFSCCKSALVRLGRSSGMGILRHGGVYLNVCVLNILRPKCVSNL